MRDKITKIVVFNHGNKYRSPVAEKSIFTTPTLTKHKSSPQKSTESFRIAILKGEKFNIKYAYDILLVTANWLCERGYLQEKDCPIRVGRMGKNRCLINTKIYHPDGTSFWRPRKLNNGLYIELLAGQDQIINRARQLLSFYKLSPNTLKLIGFSQVETAHKITRDYRKETNYIVNLNNDRFKAAKMTEVCQIVCNWLIRRGHLKHHECPIFASNWSKTRYLIHIVPIHPNGKKFFLKQRLSNGLFYEAHAGRDVNLQYLQNLLTRYGYPSDTMKLEGFDD